MTRHRDGVIGEVVELEVHGFALGGEGVGRLPDGRACFVGYAIPGELVRAQVTDARRRWARATTIEVLRASPDRVAPPCPLFGPGRCGGCTMQHVAPARQGELLAGAVVEQLRRIGRLEVPHGRVEVRRPHVGDGLGYRHRARFGVTDDGRLAYRRAHSHDLIPVDACPLLTPAASSALAEVATGWRGVEDVTLHAAADGSMALAIRASAADPVVPGSLPVVCDHDPDRDDRRRATVRHEVAGHVYEAGATSFFQSSVAAAEVLVELVRSRVAPAAGTRVVDCYAGGGLFSAALAADGAQVTAIESDPAACIDARRNTAGLRVTVVQAHVGTGAPVKPPVDVVVLDPPRTGADTAAIAWIAGLAPNLVVYVSCDPATFARDARQLVDRGYDLADVVAVDQFTHTGHVELVSQFVRSGS